MRATEQADIRRTFMLDAAELSAGKTRQQRVTRVGATREGYEGRPLRPSRAGGHIDGGARHLSVQVDR